MRNKREVKELLEQVEQLCHPVEYKFQLVVDGKVDEEMEEPDNGILVRFHIGEKKNG